MATIEIRDVGPRDGLQSESPVDPGRRAALAVALADAGIRHVEAASFVSPTAVPAMAGGGDVIGALPARDGVTWWALVPNVKGAELALAAGVAHITVTISASEGYSVKNVGRSTVDAVGGLADIAATVGDRAVLDVVVSCAFGSPFDDVIDPEPAHDIVHRALSVMPGARITLADTTGTATPRRILQVLDRLPIAAHRDLGLHLHDTRGTALANALAAIAHGVVRFDTATGGLGGSPFAPGAGGNLATEDLVLMLHDLGHTTGIDLDRVLAISAGLHELVGHAVPSRVGSAGPLPPFDRTGAPA
jgi:hydroxymethylglutaryl-CoA lyase